MLSLSTQKAMEAIIAGKLLNSDNNVGGLLKYQETIEQLVTYRQSFPSVFDSSALCKCGCWSASFLRAACAHTMNAFMGRFT